jgi:hypothetical protein
MDQPTADSMLKQLDRFIGEWTIHAKPPDGPPWPGGRARFEWLDGALLLERWTVDMPEFPNGTAIIGCDAANGTFYQLYSDDRRVCRVYEMRLNGREWTLQRTGPPFAFQRFTGTFSEDGNTISGRWELAEDGKTWTTDFDLTYSRVS